MGFANEFVKDYLPKIILIGFASFDLYFGTPVMNYGCEKARDTRHYVYDLTADNPKNIKVGGNIYGRESDDKTTGKVIDGVIFGCSAYLLLCSLNDARKRRK